MTEDTVQSPTTTKEPTMSNRTFTATVVLRGFDGEVTPADLREHINSALVDAAERNEDPDPWAGFVDVEALTESA